MTEGVETKFSDSRENRSSRAQSYHRAFGTSSSPSRILRASIYRIRVSTRGFAESWRRCDEIGVQAVHIFQRWKNGDRYLLVVLKYVHRV